MNKGIKFLVIVLLSGFSTLSFSQEITQENYDKGKDEIYEDFVNQVQNTSEISYENPEDQMVEIEKIYKQMFKKMFCLSIKYLSLPNTLKDIYYYSGGVSKDSLQNMINSLSDEQKGSEYAMLIQKHIDINQVKEGDKFSDFEATDLNGKTFKLSSLQNKNILFIYGGLGCMRSGRNYLKNLYDSTSRETFEIVIYCVVDNLEKLKEEKETFSTPYILISDFLLDHSMIKLKYGPQTTPSSYFINKNGVIENISTNLGLPIIYLDKLLKEKKL